MVKIRPGEGTLVGLLFAHSFCSGIARLYVNSASESLYLVQFGASNLPYLIMASAVTTAIIGALYSRLARHLSLRVLFTGILVFSTVMTLALWLLNTLPDRTVPAFALGVWGVVVIMLHMLEFWTLAGRVLDVRQGKRLFGLIGLGEITVQVIGGFLTPSIVALTGTLNLVLVGAGGLAGSLAILLLILQRFPVNADPAPKAPNTPAGKPARRDEASFRTLLRSRYIALIFVVSALGYLLYFFVNNVYLAQVQARFPRADEVSGFLGVFGAVYGMLTLLSRTFAYGPLINRYGVMAGILITPVATGILAVSGMLASALLGAGVVVFWLTAGLKLTQRMLTGSIQQPVIQVLYQPLSAHQRVHMQRLDNSVLNPVATFTASMVLILLLKVLAVDPITLLYPIVGALAIAIIAAYALGRSYPGALMDALKKRILSGDVELEIRDPASRHVLETAAGSDKPAVAIAALTFLENSAAPGLAGCLEGSLRHPAAEVRGYALDCLYRLFVAVPPRRDRQSVVPDARSATVSPTLSTMAAVEECIAQDSSPVVRGAAVRLKVLSSDAAPGEIEGYLTDPAPEVRLGALVGMLHRGGEEVGGAEAHLFMMCGSRLPSDRALAARAIGEAGSAHFHHPLIALLQDDEALVRNAALQSAGQIGDSSFWPLAVTGLERGETRQAAALALQSAGESAVPFLAAALDGLQALAAELGLSIAGSQGPATSGSGPRHHSLMEQVSPSAVHPSEPAEDGYRRTHAHDVRARVVRVAGQIGGAQAQRLLKSQATHPDRNLRTQVLRALSKCSFTVEGEEARWVRACVRGEIEDSVVLLAALVSLEESDASSLLRSALTHRLQAGLERVLLLLSFLYNSATMLRVLDNYSHGSKDRRAYALELLDVQADKEFRPLLLALFDDQSPAVKLKQLDGRLPRLAANTALQHMVLDARWLFGAWVGACAIYTCHRTGGRLGDVVADRARQNDLIGETAAWALRGGNGTGSKIGTGVKLMLSTIERVLILKTVSIFEGMPDETLVGLSGILIEEDAAPGETVCRKGELGTCLYIVVSGRAKAHTGDRTLNELGEGDVFGEMALLDSAPRMASVTALEDTHLFRLDQEPFYDLMADYPEVARGIIRVLTRRLRDRVQDMTALGAQLQS